MRISKNHDLNGVWGSGRPDLMRTGNFSATNAMETGPWRLMTVRWIRGKEPGWYLLSYGKPAVASSSEKGKGPEQATDENVQTWWRAATANSGEWIQVDLEKEYTVNAVQINFADDGIAIPVPGEIRGTTQARYIEEKDYATRWRLEGSLDGENYFMVQDKSEVTTDLSHD